MKTELTIFHSSSKKTDLSLKFILYGKKLTQTDTVKYLGRGGSKDFEKGVGGGGCSMSVPWFSDEKKIRFQMV